MRHMLMHVPLHILHDSHEIFCSASLDPEGLNHL